MAIFSLSRRIYEPEAQSLRLPRGSGRWYGGQTQRKNPYPTGSPVQGRGPCAKPCG